MDAFTSTRGKNVPRSIREADEAPEFTASEHEGLVLGLIQRRQPITRYQVFKSFSRAPTPTLNASKGSVYPLITRLIQQGLIRTEKSSKPRETEVLYLTDLGREVLRRWVLQIGDEHTLLFEPLRSRLLSIAELTREEQLDWIVRAKELIGAKRALLEDYDNEVVVQTVGEEARPIWQVSKLACEASLDSKVLFLDRLMAEVVRGTIPHADTEGPGRGAAAKRGKRG